MLIEFKKPFFKSSKLKLIKISTFEQIMSKILELIFAIRNFY